MRGILAFMFYIHRPARSRIPVLRTLLSLRDRILDLAGLLLRSPYIDMESPFHASMRGIPYLCMSVNSNLIENVSADLLADESGNRRPEEQAVAHGGRSRHGVLGCLVA